MEYKYKVTQLISEIKEAAKELECKFKIKVDFEDRCFCIKEIRVEFGVYYDEFSLLKYQELEELVKSIANTYHVQCNVIVYFKGSIEPKIEISHGEGKFVLYKPEISKEEEKILNEYKVAIERMRIYIYFDERGKTGILTARIDMLKTVKNIKDIAEFVNIIISNVDELQGASEVKYEKLTSSKEIIEKLKSDLDALKNTKYFEDFLKDSYHIEDRAISIVYENAISTPYSYINILDRGYFFNQCKYRDIREVKDLNFNLSHTWEDLYFDGAVSQFISAINSSLNVNRDKKIKDILVDKNIDLMDIFVDYFSEEIIQSLDRSGEMEIVLNRGEVQSIQTRKFRSSIFILGLNNKKEKIFTADLSISDINNVDKVEEDIKNGVNSIIKDVCL